MQNDQPYAKHERVHAPWAIDLVTCARKNAAKEDKELAPSDMSARLSLSSPDAGSVFLSLLRPPKGPETMAYRNSVQLPAVGTNQQSQ